MSIFFKNKLKIFFIVFTHLCAEKRRRRKDTRFQIITKILNGWDIELKTSNQNK